MPFLIGKDEYSVGGSENKKLRPTRIREKFMKKALLLLATLLAIGQTVLAYHYDFAYTYQGTTLYYYRYNGHTYVTYPSYGDGSYYHGFTQPTGDVVIPSSVTWNNRTYTVDGIAGHAFNGCTGITSVIIPNSVTGISNSAFAGCTGLISVTIPSSVTRIEECAFGHCTGLTSIDIPNTVTYIGYSAFQSCTGLSEVTIPSYMDTIGHNAFRDCSSLTTVNFNATNCTSMGTENSPVFENCNSLTMLNIGDNVTHIPTYAFRGCGGLTSVTIPSSVTTIGAAAFSNCTGLSSMSVSSGNSHYDSRNNCNAIIYTSSDILISGCKNTIIPNTVTGIGMYAFYGCNGLTSVTIPNSVTSIGNFAFSDCTGLAEVTLGNSLTVIAINAFRYCNSLTAVTIPESVTAIGDNAFRGCTGLTSVTFNAENCTYAGERQWNATPGQGGQYVYYTAFAGLSNITTFTFGDNVKTIPDYLCYGLSGLTSVTITKSVDTIGYYAFNGCSALTSVVFNAENCTYTRSPVFQEFTECGSITNITFGDSVRRIPSNLCRGFSSLTQVTIPGRVTSIGANAFSGCSGLTTITVPDAVQTMGSSAFSNCTAMATAVVGNGVSDLPSNAFAGCNHLTNLTLGSGLRTIAPDAFSGCNAVLQMTVRATTPPTSTSNPFTEFNTGIPVYVPCDAVGAYQTAPYWGFFTNYQGQFYSFSATSADPSMGYVQVITEPDCANHQAEIKANAYNDYHFVRWSDGNTNAHRYIVVTQDTAIQAQFASDNVGINDIDDSGFEVYTESGRICVKADGQQIIDFAVYDMVGREITNGAQSILPNGVYLVKVATLPARKVVVVR